MHSVLTHYIVNIYGFIYVDGLVLKPLCIVGLSSAEAKTLTINQYCASLVWPLTGTTAREKKTLEVASGMDGWMGFINPM